VRDAGLDRFSDSCTLARIQASCAAPLLVNQHLQVFYFACKQVLPGASGLFFLRVQQAEQHESTLHRRALVATFQWVESSAQT
jgi:hypothetical protein